MSNRETEKPSYGDSDETKETEDIPPLAACVKTLPEAVQLALANGWDENSLFLYARAIKAFEVTNNRRLPLPELDAAFSLLWSAAKPLLPPDADFDEYRLSFGDTFAKTNAALGANSLHEAIRRADASPLPTQATRYTSPKLKRLAAVCYHLQLLQSRSPFFLGVRDAARIMGTKNLYLASSLLNGLVRDGLMTEVEKGTRKRATRFRFNLPDAAPVDEAGSLTPVKAAATTDLEQTKPRTKSRHSSATNPAMRRAPTAYELAEKKKALQDLIKGLGHEDWWSVEQRQQNRKFKKELEQVNFQLSSLGE